jgi:hypothetical protein
MKMFFSVPPKQIQVDHMRVIYVGNDCRSFSDILGGTFLKSFCKHPIQVYVLDVSPKGELERAIRQAQLPDEALASIHVAHAADDDRTAKESLQYLTEDCDSSTLPNQVILDLPPRDFPTVAARCRALASKWFFGGPEDAKKDWPYENVRNQVKLDELRMRLSAWRYPRHLSALLFAPQKPRNLFAQQLSLMFRAWFSFIQIAEPSTMPVHKLWPWKESPDLLFCERDSLKELCKYRLYSKSTCVISHDDRQSTVNLVHTTAKSGRSLSNFPVLVAAWSQKSPDTAAYAWITRPLDRNTQSLLEPKYYQPRPELEAQLEDVWRQGQSRVVGLIGLGGSGKTLLLQSVLRRCELTLMVNASSSQQPELPTADALFIWNFYERQFPGAFLCSFAAYLNSDLPSVSTAECLDLIRSGIRKRNLRRTLLVLDGLETIQHQRERDTSEGEFRSNGVLKLLEEIASGELEGVIVFLASRLEPVELSNRFPDNYLSINVDKLTTPQACQILRACGGIADNDRLVTLAKRLNHHAMTIYHCGRLIGDFYKGDTLAVEALPSVLRTFQETGDQEVDAINRRFIQIFSDYEEHLGSLGLAVLKRVGTLDMLLSIEEFQEIFTASGDKQLAGELTGTGPEMLHASFNDLQQRDLLTVYQRRDEPTRYAIHPALSHYFSQAYFADIDDFKTPAEWGRTVLKDPGATSGALESHGFVRTRGAAVGPRGPVSGHPTKPAVLDLLEKILFRIIGIGRSREAWVFYERRMGGDRHLRSVGQVKRLERIQSWFKDKDFEPMPWEGSRD